MEKSVHDQFSKITKQYLASCNNNITVISVAICKVIQKNAVTGREVTLSDLEGAGCSCCRDCPSTWEVKVSHS